MTDCHIPRVFELENKETLVRFLDLSVAIEVLRDLVQTFFTCSTSKYKSIWKDNQAIYGVTYRGFLL